MPQLHEACFLRANAAWFLQVHYISLILSYPHQGLPTLIHLCLNEKTEQSWIMHMKVDISHPCIFRAGDGVQAFLKQVFKASGCPLACSQLAGRIWCISFPIIHIMCWIWNPSVHHMSYWLTWMSLLNPWFKSSWLLRLAVVFLFCVTGVCTSFLVRSSSINLSDSN